MTEQERLAQVLEENELYDYELMEKELNNKSERVIKTIKQKCVLFGSTPQDELTTQ